MKIAFIGSQSGSGGPFSAFIQGRLPIHSGGRLANSPAVGRNGRLAELISDGEA